MGFLASNTRQLGDGCPVQAMVFRTVERGGLVDVSCMRDVDEIGKGDCERGARPSW
jgi:hypothetical protein